MYNLTMDVKLAVLHIIFAPPFHVLEYTHKYNFANKASYIFIYKKIFFRIGLVKYASTPIIEFHLDRYSTQEEILQALEEVG